MDKGGSLSLALRASRKKTRRTSFLGGSKTGDSKEVGGLIHKSISLSHVVFRCESQSKSSFSNAASNSGAAAGKRKQRPSGSLFQKVAGQ